MLGTDCVETNSNQMIVSEDFQEDTAFTFLEYLYTPARDEGPMEIMRGVVGSVDHIYKKSFDKDKLTLELLEMAHMYRVADLQTDCAEQQKANMCDENVMEVWMVAKKCESKDLYSAAMKHIVERPSGKTMMEVPARLLKLISL